MDSITKYNLFGIPRDVLEGCHRSEQNKQGSHIKFFDNEIMNIMHH